ncbi:hypothetical protein CRG98_046269 [Punica granatum]|uniref:J domain-containing protein n=1 Tax=Punica granatum TaxID=22663 RepID=A0A2I0HPE0_PUNGR|nr:hypothetical protein CRG98_046269 [Punica granatum]
MSLTEKRDEQAGRKEEVQGGFSKNGDAVKGFQRRNKEILVQKGKVEKVIKKGSPRSSEDDTGEKGSKGKVLLPGSGWKPVPLVDIIEVPAVKRAYQRALLYLHPDKLQQKGAAPHQKYIAQQVFEILQEAWNHFNTLGPL